MPTYADRGEVCERLALKLDGTSLDRHRLLDVATALMLIARSLESDLERRERLQGKSAETYLARTALAELRDCLGWVQWYTDAAPVNEIRGKLEHALACVRRADASLGPHAARTVA
jgi:hypothetical protein